MNYCLFLCQLILIYSILLLGSSTHKFKLLYCSLRSEISISFSFFHFWLQHPGNGSKGILSSSFKSKLSEIITKNANFFPDESTREPPLYSGSKSCEDFKVLPCLQTHRLACTVLVKLPKGTVSWVRYKGHRYSTAVIVNFVFASVPLTSQIAQRLHGDGCRWMLHRQWFVSELRSVSLETPIFCKEL